MHHVSVEERLDDGVAEEEPFAPVSLPASAPRRLNSATSGRHSRPLPPPGGARRIQVPVPPPRPEHTLTPGSRPIPPPLVLPTASKNVPTPPTQPTQLSAAAAPAALQLLPSSQNWSGVTLTQPRPEPDREKNLYTEAPKKLLPQQVLDLPSSATKQPPATASLEEAASLDSSSISVIPPHHPHKSAAGLKTSNSEKYGDTRNIESIFCQRCGKCKCAACVRPRKLPEKWLCQGTLLCSKKTVVDGLSCMCCVRGLFYHCTKDSQKGEIDPQKEPCACTGNQAAARWGIMLPLLPLIPCLIAYPVWSACAKMTESVYAKCTASGCQCQNIQSSVTSERTASEPSLIAVESQPLPSLLVEKKQLLSSTNSGFKPKLSSL